MGFTNIQLIKPSSSWFEKATLNTLSNSKGGVDKRIYPIAIVIFALLVSGYLFCCKFFQKKSLSEKEKGSVVSTQSVNSVSVNDKKIHEEFEKNVENRSETNFQKDPPVNPVNSVSSNDKKNEQPMGKTVKKPSDVDFKSPKSVKMEIESPKKEDEDILELEEFSEDEKNELEGTSSEDEDDSDIDDLSSLPVVSKSTSVINGKHVSNRTLKCRKKLRSELSKINKEHGEAIDNGDCFFDSFAKMLSVILKRDITLQELRKIVSEEARKISTIKGDEMDSREDYLNHVQYDCGECLKMGLMPVWGKESREGQILCDYFNVDLTVYKVASDAEILFFIEDFMSAQSKTGVRAIGTVEIALYPGHFVPVYDKKTSNLSDLV